MLQSRFLRLFSPRLYGVVLVAKTLWWYAAHREPGAGSLEDGTVITGDIDNFTMAIGSGRGRPR